MGTLKYIADKLFSNDKEVALKEDMVGVIESGVDGGTKYTKFPDGTLITSGKIEKVYFQEQVSNANFLTSIAAINIIPNNYSFVSQPCVTACVVNSAAFTGRTVEGIIMTTNNSIRLIQNVGTSGVVASPLDIVWTAIGRWK